MDHIKYIGQSVSEIVDGIYSAFGNNSQYAIAGVPNLSNRDKPASWLENVCFNCGGRERKTNSGGKLHESSRTIPIGKGNYVCMKDVKKEHMTIKQYLIEKMGLSEKKATELIKRHH